MKRAKRIIGIVCAALLSFAMFVSMTACGNFLEGMTGSDTGNGENQTTKTTKVDFAEAAENFEKRDVKRTDIELKLKAALFIQEKQQQAMGLKDSYDVGSTVLLSRIQNKDKNYMSAKLKLSDTDPEVSGLLDGIIQTVGGLSTYSALLGQNSQETAETVIRYLTTVHHYLTRQVDVSAELGSQNGVYNLKARYNDKEARDHDEVWLAADDSSLLSWLNNTAKLDVTSNELNSYMMKTIFSGLTKQSDYYDKDSANKYVDKKGQSEYKIKVKTDAIVTSSLFSGLLELAGVIDKTSVISKYKNYFSSVQNWFTIDINEVNATVKNDMPLNVNTGVKLDINVDVIEVTAIIDKLFEDGVVDKQSSRRAKSIFNVINTYLCGTDGNKDTIGISIQTDLSEDFITDATKCKLDGSEYADYFLGFDAEVEGRMDMRLLVAGIVEDVESYVDDFLRSLSEKYKDDLENIRRDILEKVSRLKEQGSEVITAEDIKGIIAEVMQKYVVVPPEEEADEESGSGSGNTIDKEKAGQIIDDIINHLGDKN